QLLSKMVGRQLPIFSAIVPCWIIVAMAGWRGLRGVWPAAVTAGVAFAVPQFLISNFHGPWLVDVVSGACSIVAVIGLLRIWRPRERWQVDRDASDTPQLAAPRYSGRQIFSAWMPWLLLGAFIFGWGLPQTKG